MKLRTKAVLIFGAALLVLMLVVVFYAQYIVGGVFKKQTTNNFRAIVEQTESTFLAIAGNAKVRTLDWTSDLTLQKITKAVIDAPTGTTERARFAKEFAEYVSKKKMPYDKTIFIAELLDRDGIVSASTRPERIGVDEKSEEFSHNAHFFSKTITSSFGEVFVKSIVFEEDEGPDPMTHATARFFIQNSSGSFDPLDAVLLIHFTNTKEIAGVLNKEISIHVDIPAQGEEQTGKASIENYKTFDTYIVNSEQLMVTPSRFIHTEHESLHQKIDTLPVRECLENGREINEEYDNYQGIRVLGVSVCLEDDGLVLVSEISKDEVYAPVTALVRWTAVGGAAALIFGLLLLLLLRRPLKRIDDIVLVTKQAAGGDLDAQAEVSTNDEIGHLALSFNEMIGTIRDNEKELQASKHEIEIKANILEKSIKEHEQQEVLLEESKKATLNLLEDMLQTKEKLEVEDYRLQTILSSIGDGLVLIDGQYNISLVNPKAEEFLGFTHKELLGKDLRTVIKLFKKKKEEMPALSWPTEEMFAKKSTVSVGMEAELSLATERHTAQIPIALSVAPLGGGLAGAVIVIRDVTEDRALDDAKSGFISVASHQLRTPLTTIRWYSEMLLSDDVGKLSPAQQDFLKEVHSGAERLYQTIDLLLGISRVESGRIRTEKTSIDLAVFTEDIAKELRPSIVEKKLTLTITPLPMPVVISLDTLMLRQVVLNLISNAIRYTNEGGSIEVRWKISDDSKEVVYWVRDDGIGIPRAQQSRIFTKFFRAENALVKVPDGSGLGLALVKELVESWGGKVWFETEERKGTTFFFTVPIAPVP